MNGSDDKSNKHFKAGTVSEKIDIRQDGMVRFLPVPIQPYYILMRLDRPVGWMLLFLPCLWGLAAGVLYTGSVSLGRLALLSILFLVGAVLMRGAGCIINDLWDRELDRQVARTAMRPLASGRITKKAALAFLGGVLILSFFILLQLPLPSILIGVSSLALVVAYPLMKRWTWWPQLFLGLTFNIGVLVGFTGLTGQWSIEVIWLYLAGICWTIGYDTIYALQDIEDDIGAGIKSTARLFGKYVRIAIGFFYALTILFTGAFLTAIGNAPEALIFLLLPACHFGWQVMTLKPDDAKNALMLFKNNALAGFLVLVCLMAASQF